MSPVYVSVLRECGRGSVVLGVGCSAPDYLLEVLASLLVVGVDLRWGVGILEGLAPCARGADRGVAWRLVSGVADSDASEHTDWMSEMSKSDASLPRRLLPRLPALLPGRLRPFLESNDCPLAFNTAAEMRVPSSPDWKPFPDRYPGSRSLLPWMGVLSVDDPWLSKESDDLRVVEDLLFVSQGLS